LSTYRNVQPRGIPEVASRDTVLAICVPDETPAFAPRTEAVEVLSHGSRDERLVALTFDACSSRKDTSGYDAAIIDILIEKNVPATLFLGGKWMEEHPAAVRFLASRPQFEIGNHTYSHPHLTRIPDDSIRWQFRETEKILRSLTGRGTRMFRAPYGEIDDRVVRLGASEGLQTIQYDLASGDPDKSFTRERLSRYVIRSARNGSIVVMHMNEHGWHTAEALPAIIDALRSRGFTFVTVDALLDQKKHAE
jgi:peptidoglycan-N-acetylglucosamine deacetylase